MSFSLQLLRLGLPHLLDFIGCQLELRQLEPCMYVCMYLCMYVFFFLELRLVFAGHLGLVPQVRCAPSVGVSEEVYRHLLFRVSFHCIIRRIRFRETELLWCRWRRSRYVACSSRWSRWLWLGIMASECDL